VLNRTVPSAAVPVVDVDQNIVIVIRVVSRIILGYRMLLLLLLGINMLLLLLMVMVERRWMLLIGIHFFSNLGCRRGKSQVNELSIWEVMWFTLS